MPSIAGIAVRSLRKLHAAQRFALRAAIAAIGPARRIWLLPVVLIGPGCTVCHQARRTLCQEPSRFSAFMDRKRSVHTYRCWAKQAWMEERKACPNLPPSEAYELGFSDGFVNYVYAGGSGEPPPVPPREFWNVCERLPDGKAAAADWFAGYRHGARVARAGGYRERGVVLTSLIPCDGEFGPSDLSFMPPNGFAAPEAPIADGEVLGPALEESLPGAEPENSQAPEASTEPAMETNPAPAESSGELPAPSTKPIDQTTQESASQFKSALLNAAERHHVRPSFPSQAENAVRPAAAVTRSSSPSKIARSSGNGNPLRTLDATD